MRDRYFRYFSLVFLLLGAAGCAAPQGATLHEKRNYVQEMRKDVLSELYKEKPYVKTQVENALGYGVFSNINTNLLLVSTARGYGIVRDNKTGRDIYMKMGQVGVGPGIGIKDKSGSRLQQPAGL